ncbi:restriction endonuclease subunit S [Vreelandella indica]|uniref:restriction endonuclease subunit S n=1 Tax=Vreelandella indica TaxID=3126500 RepID=UPI00300DD225
MPVGYKQTEIGIIPEDWETLEIGKFAPLQRGFDLPSTIRKDGKYPVVYSNGIANTHYQFQVKGPGVVTGRSGTLGKVHFVGTDYWPHNTSLWVTNFNKADPKFVYFLFTYIGFERFASGSGVPTLNRNDAHSFKTAFPPTKAEQTAIANALSDVDALISELEKLIAKKQAIKTATMQQLLTGRTRLPQFALREDGTTKSYKQSELGEIPEDWELLEVGKFAPLQRGFDLPSTIRKDGKYPVVYSNGIANTHHQFQVKGPGVVTGRSGTLGKVHFVDTDYWPHNTSLWVTNFCKAEPKFVYFLFTYIDFERFASGSGVPTLNRNDAHSFKTALPPTKLEQKTIANILSDIDEEIHALEQRLGKIRQIKQGMMQELLTGKTRLVAPAA